MKALAIRRYGKPMEMMELPRPVPGPGDLLVRVREGAAAKRPAGLDDVQAASLPLVGLTAWQALVDIAHLSAGQSVLIHAGSGGVGTFAIQLARHLAARVSTTASARNHELLGGETLLRSFEVVKRGGVVVTVGGKPDAKFALAWGLSLPLVWIRGFLNRKVDAAARKKGVRFEYLFMRASGPQLAEIGALVEEGALRPVLDKVSPFESAADAIAYVESGRAVGKVVIRGAE